MTNLEQAIQANLAKIKAVKFVSNNAISDGGDKTAIGDKIRSLISEHSEPNVAGLCMRDITSRLANGEIVEVYSGKLISDVGN